MVREALLLVADMPFDHPPPRIGRRIHRPLRSVAQSRDPCHEVEFLSTTLAMEPYPPQKQRVRAAVDRSGTAVRSKHPLIASDIDGEAGQTMVCYNSPTRRQASAMESASARSG